MKDYIHWLMTRNTPFPLIFTIVPLLLFMIFGLIAFVFWDASNAFLRLELALLIVATLPYIYYRVTMETI